MIHVAKPQDTLRQAGDCLSDVALQDLLEDALPNEQLKTVVSHLDTCGACRTRLESAAGDADTWSQAARCLQTGNSFPPSESKTLADTLHALRDETRTFRVASGREQTTPLESCDAPGCIGRLGRYELVEILGRGGMGVVYKAFDQSLNRHVAIKLIRSTLTDNPEALARFQREARAAASIRNQHVVAIHHIEEAAAGPYLVMEYVEGISLEERLQDKQPLKPQEIARVGSEIALGLAAAHDKGLIHRDVKPANILLERPSGRVKITDFGLARSLHDSGITHEDCIAGTPEYISPEQAAGASIDHRADLFSLGSVLYAMCTGVPPFRADEPLAVLRRTREDSPTPIDEVRTKIPAALGEVISKLLKKDPEERFATAIDVADALDATCRTSLTDKLSARNDAGSRPTKKIRLGWLLAAASLLLVIGFGVSEVSGLTNVIRFVAAAGAVSQSDGQAKSDGADADDSAGSGQPERSTNKRTAAGAESAPGESDAGQQPARVQIVTPDALWRERIQTEKDQIEREPSPFLVHKFTGHTGPVTDVVFTPDGESLLSCSGWPVGDRTLRQWDIATGKQTKQFDTTGVPQDPAFSGGREAPGEFQSLAVTPDGKRAIATSTGGAVGVWDVTTGELVRNFSQHTATAYSVAVSPDGKTALTGGRDQIARLWDIGSSEELLRMPNHKSWIRTVAISPDGKQALTGGLDQVLRLWDLEQATEVREMKAGDGWVWSAVFSPSGTRAASASDGAIHLWDLETGQELRCFKGHKGDVTSVAFSPNGRYLLSGSYDKTVRLWDVDSGEQLEMFLGHRDWIWSVKFSPDGRQAVSAGGGRFTKTGGTEPGIDFALRLWKLPAGKPRVADPKPVEGKKPLTRAARLPSSGR